MLGTVVKEAGGLLDRRFFLNGLLPVLAFLGCCLLTVAAARGGVAGAVNAWQRQDVTIKIIHMLAFLVVALLAAAWLASAATTLVRLYEGYWPGLIGRPLRALGLRWHRNRLAALDPVDDRDYARLHTSYPSDPSEVMPTRLGNILKNAELHPEDRYGLDAVVVWPRLYPLLPEEQRTALIAARTELEFFLTVSALAAAYSATSGIFLILAGADPGLFLLCHATGGVVALLAYRAALPSARLYGQQVKVTFDVHRALLLTAIGQQDTAGIDEHLLWQALARHWYRGIPLAATYRAAAASPSPDDLLLDDQSMPSRRSLPPTAVLLAAILITSALGAVLLQ
ncbi:hypothetical protein [Microbispora catharanthi]|uniref:Uncharacterized protein n=1 Tax=Microbispora catharanthi TaxID=1712871 RepID=A0A5N6B8I6_9ACTN|nr:hypothetical protein [Microbispora catharanthi]KAB8176796.1 hypothetical protein FH610_038220 [Microbispora catharanthi]